MISVSLSTLVDVLDATLIGDDRIINSVSTDTRKIEAGSYLLPLLVIDLMRTILLITLQNRVPVPYLFLNRLMFLSLNYW